MISSTRLTNNGTTTIDDPFIYRSIIGWLQYILIIRPELSYRFCLDWGVESWGCEEVEVWRKLRVFGLEYVRVNVWEKFIEVCEWCDGCKDILNYF